MTEQERARWTKLVGDFETSDMTQREFATQRGISFSNLRNWIYKLRKESRPLAPEAPKVPGQGPERAPASEGSRLVPVRVVASAAKPRSTVVAVSGGELVEIRAPVRHPGPLPRRHRSPVRALAGGGSVAVIGIPQSVRILIGTTPIDMRKSIDGLTAIVQAEMGEDAYSGHLFVFVSRRRDRVKILAWDKGGFVLVYKRLERGQFKLPHMDPSTDDGRDRRHASSPMLLDGIDFGRVRRPDHWKPPSQMDHQGRRPMDKPAAP